MKTCATTGRAQDRRRNGSATSKGTRMSRPAHQHAGCHWDFDCPHDGGRVRMRLAGTRCSGRQKDCWSEVERLDGVGETVPDDVARNTPGRILMTVATKIRGWMSAERGIPS